MPDSHDLMQLLWMAVLVFSILVVSRRLANDIRPIFVNVVNGVAKNAGSNALEYAFAIGFGLSASLLVLSDEATKYGWVYVATAAKVAQPFIAGCVAYATKSGFRNRDGGTGSTTPPFPPQKTGTP